MAGMWKEFRRRFEPEAIETEEDETSLRGLFIRSALRLATVFALLFGLVFFAFWWSGSAIRFGADRAANRGTPTWKVLGTVRNAVTHEPVPWASIDDDPAARAPLFHTDASVSGGFELL